MVRIRFNTQLEFYRYLAEMLCGTTKCPYRLAESYGIVWDGASSSVLEMYTELKQCNRCAIWYYTDTKAGHDCI